MDKERVKRAVKDLADCLAPICFLFFVAIPLLMIWLIKFVWPLMDWLTGRKF